MAIEDLVQKFDAVEKDVGIISKVLLFFIALLTSKGILLIYNERYDDIWSLIGAVTSIIAALLISKIATRLILNGQIVREDERRIKLVMVTHHLIAITRDLRSNVGYYKKKLIDLDQPAIILSELSKTIERRYETLLERDAYLYLPGRSVDVINNISGNIYGIRTLALQLVEHPATNSNEPLSMIYQQPPEPLVSQLKALLIDLDTLINQIYEIRATVGSKE